jgi:hypothetical protein
MKIWPSNQYFLEKTSKTKKNLHLKMTRKQFSTRWLENIDTHFWLLKFLISNRHCGVWKNCIFWWLNKDSYKGEFSHRRLNWVWLLREWVSLIWASSKVISRQTSKGDIQKTFVTNRTNLRGNFELNSNLIQSHLRF